MELYVFRHSEYEELYNCSVIDVEAVPLEQRRWPIVAWITIILCAVYYALYLPCMFSFWKNMHLDKHEQNTCYTLVFYIGVVDMSILWILGFLQGWLSLQGAVFCSKPTLIYFAGLTAQSLVMAESFADILLALNRCMDILSQHLAIKMFSGRRLWVWLGSTSIAYCIFNAIFEKPLLFNGIHFAWFMDPYEGYIADPDRVLAKKYSSPALVVHQFFLTFATPIIYVLFIIVFHVKASITASEVTQGSREQSNITHAQKMAFLQVLLISALNSVAGSIYFMMEKVGVSQGLVLVAQFAWFHIHGFPPVIYLCLNKTIRKDCRRLYKRVIRRIGVTTTTALQHHPPAPPRVNISNRAIHPYPHEGLQPPIGFRSRAATTE